MVSSPTIHQRSVSNLEMDFLQAIPLSLLYAHNAGNYCRSEIFMSTL